MADRPAPSPTANAIVVDSTSVEQEGPSPTGGGAEDLEARGYDDGYRHGRSDEAHASDRQAHAAGGGVENWTGQRPADVYGLAAERLANPALTVPAEEVLGSLDDPWSARVQVSIDALTHDQPDWQARAGELAKDLAGRIKRGLGTSVTGDATDEEARACSPALARYHEAIAQHSGEER